jgi:antitoxin MazE
LYKKTQSTLGAAFDSQTKADAAAFGVRSSSSPTLDQLVAEMKQLGGPDYDFGAEEWDMLPTEYLDKLINSMDEAGPEGQSETVDWGPDRGSEIIEDDYSPKPAKD